MDTINKTELKKFVEEYNEKYSRDNPPALNDVLESKMKRGAMSPEEASVVALMDFYAEYKNIDINLIDFLNCISLMAEIAEEEKEMSN